MPPDATLLQSYNIPVPRYTSYPTVPFWKEGIDVPGWAANFSQSFAACNTGQGISLYLHFPFCESLCLYCGCNKKVTTNHKVEEQYLQALIAEWSLYRSLMHEPPVIREIHLGGGTPTFFSSAGLRRVLSAILEGAVIHPDHNFSLEGHPNNTTREHLDTLFDLGFRRISYGVQDTNLEVQRLVNRVQPFSAVKKATEDARAAGFTAVNFDLIYGLPGQTPDLLARTIWQSLGLSPDRIAFYSYAHTPWINCGQRLIDEKTLPSGAEKLALYQTGVDMLIAGGYAHIGMDHFALPGDDLYKAWQAGTLHRNFMGYTTKHSGLLLGLGMSSISDTGTAFAQNDKTLGGYYQAINDNNLAVRKGYVLNEEDKVFRRHILDIACRGYTILEPAWSTTLEEWTLPRLHILARDGLVTLDGDTVRLTETGRPLLRHVCKAFDLHLLRSEQAQADPGIRCGRSAAGPMPLFSKGI